MTNMILTAFTVAALAASGKPPFDYRFVPNTERLVGIYRNKSLLIGRLDADGEFHQTQRLEPFVGPGLEELELIVYSGPGYEHLNSGSTTPRKVYEFRSGMLIPGTIQEQGNFVPEEGGKIVSFKTYQYSASVTPIWNLPGRYNIVVKAKK